MGTRTIVVYFTKIERMKNKTPKNIFFLVKRKKDKRTRKIIAISLCPLTKLSITTNGLRANKTTGTIFLDNFQIRNTDDK